MSNWKNVNNWHWTTKNCMNWAKNYLSDNLKNLSVERNGIIVKIDSLEECTGDADLSNRKGKIITIYDIQLTLRWSGTSPDSAEAKGTIHVPEFAHDTDPDDIIFDISVDDDVKEKDQIKNSVRDYLAPLLREKLQNFSRDLIENHSKDVYIEPSELGTASPQRAVTPVPVAPEAAKANEKINRSSPPRNTIVNTTKLTETIEFQTSADQIYEAYLDPARVAIWSRAEPKLERHVGGEFSLFGGNITGVFTELVPNQRIAQTWRLKEWPEDHFSNVILRFDQMSDFTRLHVEHNSVPVGEEEVVRRNWQNYYWNPIKSVFGYGFFTTSVSYPSSSSPSRSSAPSQKPRRKKINSRKNKPNDHSNSAFGLGVTAALVVTAIVLGFVFSARSTPTNFPSA